MQLMQLVNRHGKQVQLVNWHNVTVVSQSTSRRSSGVVEINLVELESPREANAANAASESPRKANAASELA